MLIEKQDGCQRDLALVSNEEMSKTSSNVALSVSRPRGDREADLRAESLKAKTSHRDEAEVDGKAVKRETDRIPSTKDSERTRVDSPDNSLLEFQARGKQHGYEPTRNFLIESGVRANGFSQFSTDGVLVGKREGTGGASSSLRRRESAAEEEKNQIPISKDQQRGRTEAQSGSTKRAPLKPVRSKKCKVNKEPNPQEQTEDARRNPRTTEGPEMKMASEGPAFDSQKVQHDRSSSSEHLNNNSERGASHKDKGLTSNGHHPATRGLSHYGHRDTQDVKVGFLMNFGTEDDKLLFEDQVQVFDVFYGSKFSPSDQMAPLHSAILGQRTREPDVTMRNRLQKSSSMVKTKRRPVVTAWHLLVQSQETKASHERCTSIPLPILHLSPDNTQLQSILTHLFKRGGRTNLKPFIPPPPWQGLQGREAFCLHWFVSDQWVRPPPASPSPPVLPSLPAQHSIRFPHNRRQ